LNAFPLEAIEKASVDELRNLQLKRLKVTLQHAYANSRVYKARFVTISVHHQK
jgi:phenylacetate-CoA ligase